MEALANHRTTEGSVFGQNAGPFGFGSAPGATVRFGALGSQHHFSALVTGDAVPPWESSTMRCTVLLL